MKGMGQFNPEFYQRYRPDYPVELFADLPERLKQKGFSSPFQVADLGCGAGHSTFSFLRTGIPARVVGVDVDPGMLAKARENASRFARGVDQHLEFSEGGGEQTGLAAQSIDLILIGSAFHWMDPVHARQEFDRILRPGGMIRIFEYQFPKSLHNPALNEWIRRQFNLYWKAPGQVPRGSLQELTAGLRERFEFASGRKADRKVLMKLTLTPEELAGLIFSQSRVLHFEATLPSAAELASFREFVIKHLQESMNGEPDEWDFKLSYLDFSKR